MRISDWSSDVCSSDLCFVSRNLRSVLDGFRQHRRIAQFQNIRPALLQPVKNGSDGPLGISRDPLAGKAREIAGEIRPVMHRSEEHTSELQSLMRISYAVFCLQKKQL